MTTSQETNNDEVICPNCSQQFRAIPVNVQRLMLDVGFEPPFMEAPPLAELQARFTPPAPAPQEALAYATRLAQSIHAKHYSEVTQWKPLPDLMGVLTQIDNMTCGLTRATTSQEAREYPPLPEPDGYAVLTPNGSGIVPPQEARGYKNAYAFYTADQMRSYVDADRKARQQEAVRYMPIMGTPLAMPFDLLDERQARINHGGQSLARLAERGGLDPGEALAIVKRERWDRYQHMKRPEVLVALVAAIAKGEQT